MDKAVLELDLAKAGASRAGVVYAGLRLRLNDVLFPHAEWTDFVVVVLDWWASAALRLLSHAPTTVEIRFMEGPFLVEVQAQIDGAWRLKLVETKCPSVVIAEGIVDALPLIRSIWSTSDDALALCRQRGWWSSDAESLDRALSLLKRSVAIA